MSDPLAGLSGTQRVLAAVQPYFTGGCGACFASCVIHPIDLIKVRIQISKGKANPMKLVKDLIKNEGVMKLYAGLSAAVMRQAVYGTARLGMHRSLSEYLKKRNGGKLPIWQSTVSGLVTGAIAGMIGNPFDLALVRMQADGMKPAEQKRNYKNVFDAVIRIAKEEGILTWWRGCIPMIFRAMAMNAGMLAAYDQSRNFFLSHLHNILVINLCATAVAGFSCAFFSLPFDMMKTRLMNMSKDAAGNLQYKGLWDCFIKILKNEGVLGFWKGFLTYYFRCAPHSMVILLTMEGLNSAYEKLCFGRRIHK